MSYTIPTNSSRHRLLSVIIPIYNGADTLGEQLDALRFQEYDGDWEIVAVNNLSTDDSICVVQAYQRSMPQLRLVHALKKHNKGYASNVGARVARGDRLLFCDQDDIAAPGWLSALAQALEMHHFVAGTLELEALNPSSPWRPTPNGSRQIAFGFLPFVMGCNLAVSRQAFEAVGGFSEDLPVADDVDISWRLQLRGYAIYDAPEAVLHYRYRKTHKELWKQLISYAESHVDLYRRFASHGMPQSSIREVLRTYKWLLRNSPYLLADSDKRRAMWILKAATCWGRLLGSLRYRTFYL